MPSLAVAQSATPLTAPQTKKTVTRQFRQERPQGVPLSTQRPKCQQCHRNRNLLCVLPCKFSRPMLQLLICRHHSLVTRVRYKPRHQQRSWLAVITSEATRHPSRLPEHMAMHRSLLLQVTSARPQCPCSRDRKSNSTSITLPKDQF